MNKFVKLFGAFIIYFIFIKGCNGECVSQNRATTYESRKSGGTFFKICCSDDKNASLRWLDSKNQDVPFGPGTDSNVYTEKNGDEINLYVNTLSKGIFDYTCVAEVDGKNYTLQHIIEVFDPPIIFNADEIQNIIKGSDGVVSCMVSPINDSYIKTEWFREKFDEIPILDSEKYKISLNIGLNITNVDDEDGGFYKCRATHYVTGDVVEKQIQVDVVTLPTIKTLKVTPTNIVNEGDTLTIECIALGQPHPTYTWKKISDALTKENTTRWTQLINTITIDNVNRDDRGDYVCTAYNIGGSVNSTVSIEVQHAPAITEFKNITVLEGSIAQFICKATGNPLPYNEIWTNFEMDPAQPLISRNLTETEASIIITFTNVSRFHGGLYYCSSNNTIDVVSGEAYMHVLHNPYIIGSHKEVIWGWKEKTLNLSCENESNPPGVIQWNFKGNNSILDDPQLIAEVMKNISINSNYATITINSEAYYGIYECTVVNEFGQDVKEIYLKRAFVPGPIQNATVNEIKPTSVIFDITGPPETKITGYVAQYDELENYNITNIHVNRTWSVDRPYKIDQLKPNKTYNVRFAAKNELGDGDWSEFKEFITTESTVPDAPTWNHDSEESAALQVVSESTTITVKWNEPESNGDPIDYYVIRYCSSNQKVPETDENTICEDRKIIQNEITLENLNPNATYSIDILAHNSIGNSSVTSTLITTAALTSDQPTSLLSAGAIIAVSVVTVLVCMLILDIILFMWQKKGIIASCFNKKKDDNFNSRDNKGLLKHTTESDGTLKKSENRQKQPEYKSTGVITGKHSAV